jgi:hypothetical protein
MVQTMSFSPSGQTLRIRSDTYEHLSINPGAGSETNSKASDMLAMTLDASQYTYGIIYLDNVGISFTKRAGAIMDSSDNPQIFNSAVSPVLWFGTHQTPAQTNRTTEIAGE